MPDRIQLSDEQRRCLLDPDSLPSSVDVSGRSYVPEQPIAAGYKGVIWRVKNQFGRPRALKLCIYEDYENRSYLQEMSRVSALESYREFASLEDTGLVELRLGSLPKQKFVCFVEEWIDGLTLKDFVDEKTDFVTASFLEAIS